MNDDATSTGMLTTALLNGLIRARRTDRPDGNSTAESDASTDTVVSVSSSGPAFITVICSVAVSPASITPSPSHDWRP